VAGRRVRFLHGVWIFGFLLLAGVAAWWAADRWPPSQGVDRGAIALDPGAAPRRGGEIRYGVVGDLRSFNPLLGGSPAENLVEQHLFHYGLLKYDERLEPAPNLAARWQFSPDGLTWTFHLRPGVRWHDGTPVTAADVRFTLETILHPDYGGPWAPEFDYLQRVEEVDAATVRLHLWEPHAPLLNALTLPLLPAHRYREVPVSQLAETSLNAEPLGYGPYRFTGSEAGRWVELAAVDEYWDGGPYLEKVVILAFPDEDSALAALAAGEIDYLPYIPPAEAAARQAALAETYRFFTYLENGYVYIGPNHRHPVLSRKEVRQALMLAINRRRLINDVLDGLAIPAYSHYPPVTAAHHRNIRSYDYDPRQAAVLLEEAGFDQWGPDGIRRDGRGNPLAFSVLTDEGNDELRAVLAAVAEDFRQVGAAMTVEPLPFGSLLARLHQGRFEAYALGWRLGLDPDATLFFHSRAAAADGSGQIMGFNDIGFRHPQVDRLLDEGRSALDTGARWNVYRQLHALLNEELPYLFLYTPVRVGAVHRRFAGVVETPLGPAMPHLWYVEDGEPHDGLD